MTRLIEPEWLDELPPDDPDAVRSRRDLCRVNAWMGHHGLMAGALRHCCRNRPPAHIVELGAGDGDFLLRVAQRLATLTLPPHSRPGQRDGNPALGRVNAEIRTGSVWDGLRVTLLDRQSIVPLQTLTSFAALGLPAERVRADVFHWTQAVGALDVVVANLFLHHFHEPSLAGLFRALAARAQLFIALEPRRGALPWVASRLLWAIGCNLVTQHDARMSVQAGFDGDELSRLWPADSGWQLTERRAGAFSHFFAAQKLRPLA